MIDRGNGRPVVLIPGIQGRWEWMRPTVRALSARLRVLTFSMTNASDDARPVFDRWIEKIDAALHGARLSRATLVGVSFGGLVAVRYAALRPQVVSSLILVSPPAPVFVPDPRTTAYLAKPRRSLPVFAFRAVGRLWPEVASARPTRAQQLALFAACATRAARFPLAPSVMAQWARDWMATDLLEDCARVHARTLLITGEPHLDRVVPVAGSLEYLQLIRGARHETLTGTGHMGSITRPGEFARMVSDFVGAAETRP